MYGLGDLMGICDYVLLGCAAHGRVRFFIRPLALRNTSRSTLPTVFCNEFLLGAK
jgi:lipid-A-disaccharide synthase-like uncharacterized protein